MFLFLGIVLGVAGALAVPALFAPVDVFVSQIIGVSATLADRASARVAVSSLPELASFAEMVVLVASVAVPGLIPVAALLVARMGRPLRQMVSALLVVAAVAGFFVLPLVPAILAAVCLVGLSFVTSLAIGAALEIPLGVVAGYVTAASVARFLDGDPADSVMPAADRVAELAGAGNVGLWTLLLIAVAVAPFFAAVALTLKGR